MVEPGSADVMPSRTQAHEKAAQELVAEALASGSGVRLRVRGGCMDPLLEEGDWVWVVPVHQLLPGAIVLAQSTTGNLVCHRLLECVEGGYRLAGDRTFALEEHSAEQILGEVHSAERGDSRLLLAGPRWRRLGRFLVRWHLFSYGLLGGIGGRLVEAVRQRFVELAHRFAWRVWSAVASQDNVF